MPTFQSTSYSNSNNDQSIEDRSEHNTINYYCTTVYNYYFTTVCQRRAQGLEILLTRAVVSASRNSSGHESCFPGTRQDVLDPIYKWVDSSTDNRPVCLVFGPARSGTTTIATTIAVKYDKENRLAGSFFFSRDPRHDAGRQSIDKIVATIAYQYSISRPIVKKKIIQALNSDPAILYKSLETQFHALLDGPSRRRRFKFMASRTSTTIVLTVWAAVSFAQTFSEVWITFIFCIIFHQPASDRCEMMPFILTALMAASAAATHPTVQTVLQAHIKTFLNPPPVVAVIDAPDVCHESKLLEPLIKILTDKFCESPVPIRFILTIRPEEKILGEFNRYRQRVYSINLMDFPAHKDINLFFKKKLNTLKVRRLPAYGASGDSEEWPSQQDLDSLVKTSEGVFGSAVSLMEFIADDNRGGDPKSRLRVAIDQHDGLDTVFRQVLQVAPEFLNPDFRRLLGAMCLLYDELSLGSLAVLLRLNGTADARRILRGCRSILHIPQTDHENITFIHTSLHGFLTDSNRARNPLDHIDYWIDPGKQHLSLLYDCIQLIVAESENGSIKKANQVPDHFKPSVGYAWENWPHHLLDLQLTYRGIIDLSKVHFGERYDGLLLSFLDRFIDGTLIWPVTWAFGHRAVTWPGLELELLRLQDEDTPELSNRIRRIGKTLETLRFKTVFPGAHIFDIKDLHKPLAQGVDHSAKGVYNVAVVVEAEAQTAPDELNHILDQGKWEQFVSKVNVLVAKNGADGIYEREDFEDSHPPEDEPQPETQQIQKSLVIYTSDDAALKTLKIPIDIIFTLTPPTGESDRPWPAIVWKTLHFEKTTTAQNELFWSNQSGFCVVEELDDTTLKPGDLYAVVKPGYAAILQNVNDKHDMSQQLSMPFKTNTIAVSNVTGSRLRLALCSTDPTKGSDILSPVVDLDCAASFGKQVFACSPPTMLQAYAVSGFRDQQLIDPSQLLCPLFLDTSSSAPQAIDLSKLDKPLTAFQLYSNDTGAIVLEMTDVFF